MILELFKKTTRFNWVFGRQNSGYSKVSLLESKFPIPFDVYILKFPEGSFIPEHTDPVKSGYKHFRFNIILKKSKSGGDFISEHNIFNFSRLKFFRPDISKHSVTRVISGSRFVLSIGFLLKDKNKGE